jgi:hypothetical protein
MGVYLQKYPALAGILSDEPGKPKRNVIARNICSDTPWDIFSLRQDQQFVRQLVTVQENVTEGDGGVAAPKEGNFRLKDDSAAAKLGFRPIPVERIGLYKDEYRQN